MTPSGRRLLRPTRPQHVSQGRERCWRGGGEGQTEVGRRGSRWGGTGRPQQESVCSRGSKYNISIWNSGVRCLTVATDDWCCNSSTGTVSQSPEVLWRLVGRHHGGGVCLAPRTEVGAPQTNPLRVLHLHGTVLVRGVLGGQAALVGSRVNPACIKR